MTTKLIEAVKAYLDAEKPFFTPRRHGTQRMPTNDERIKFYAARDALALAMLEAEAATEGAKVAQPSVVDERDITRILLDVVPGADGMGLEVYAKTVSDVEAVLTKQSERIEELEIELRKREVCQS